MTFAMFEHGEDEEYFFWTISETTTHCWWTRLKQFFKNLMTKVCSLFRPKHKNMHYLL